VSAGPGVNDSGLETSRVESEHRSLQKISDCVALQAGTPAILRALRQANNVLFCRHFIFLLYKFSIPSDLLPIIAKETKMPKILEYHRRFLPHYQETQQIFSLTWRLEGELPQQILLSIKEMQAAMAELRNKAPGSVCLDLIEKYRQSIERFDEQLGRHPATGINLCSPDLAPILTHAFHFYDSNLYELHAYCVMPNHVHMLLKPYTDDLEKRVLLSDIVHRIKSYTAKQILKQGYGGQKVWRADYFDRYIRSEKDYANTVAYILYNPVKAGLVDEYSDWDYNYFWKEFT
jgi:REP element-mobilizing transposase RayT